MGDHWTKIFIFVVILASTRIHAQDSPTVNITFIENGVAKGAVCLDGSPGGYFYDKGFGNGADSWIVYLEGGGWCRSVYECQDRAKQALGSTVNTTQHSFITATSRSQTNNSDFYNWNKVFIPYCDGASYSADVEEVDPETKLYRRGARIFKGVMEGLLAKGMKNAKNALLMGNSAGGLATMLNCDRFRSFLPSAATVKCVADSGFFLHAKDVPGLDKRERLYRKVTDYHQLANVLPKSCTSRMNDSSLCMFPENFIGDIKTPLFVLNSVFDSYQLYTNVEPPVNDVNWMYCLYNISTCKPDEIPYLQKFRSGFLTAFNSVADNPSRGTFFSSCYIHDFLWRGEKWSTKPRLQNKTISKAIGDWYFNRSQVRILDQSDTPIDCGLD